MRFFVHLIWHSGLVFPLIEMSIKSTFQILRKHFWTFFNMNIFGKYFIDEIILNLIALYYASLTHVSPSSFLSGLCSHTNFWNPNWPSYPDALAANQAVGPACSGCPTDTAEDVTCWAFTTLGYAMMVVEWVGQAYCYWVLLLWWSFPSNIWFYCSYRLLENNRISLV